MELKDYVQTIHNRLSGAEAYAAADKICGYNRVPLSEGYDRAAACCLEEMRRAGVESRIFRIPLERGDRRWTQEGFDGWTCRRGELRLTGPVQELLCDYRENPMSLIQRSGDASMGEVPIVMLDRGSSPDAYPDIELRHTVVFVPVVPYAPYLWAVTQRGALGIITDCIPETFNRDRRALPDARSYFTFYWRRDERPCFGFVLTPRQGDRLRELCRRMEEDWRRGAGPRCPTCEIQIETAAAPGCVQVVEALIPGRTEDEVVVTAHLCHAGPSANDNASGCAGAMEAMRTLAGLIREGSLPRPRCSLRMLLVPEVSGTFAYLAACEERIPRIKAAINLDMIGRRQEGRSGMLGIWAPPDALPSCGIDLMAYVRSLSNREAPSFNIGGYVTPFHSQIMEYNGGSDHYIYCDPTVGIPCITLMQWMDKNYHTSSDTMADIDPEMLHKSAAMAACWLYAAASPDVADLPHVFAHMRERFLTVLHAAAERRSWEPARYGELCRYEMEVFQQASGDALRFYGEEARPLVERQREYLRCLAEMEAGGALPVPRPLEGQHDRRIPRRRIRGPLSFVGSMLDAEAEEEIEALARRNPGLYGYHSVNHFILFRVDGVRTVSEIARLVGWESRYDSEAYVSGYLDVLSKCGVINFDRQSCRESRVVWCETARRTSGAGIRQPSNL